MKISDNGLAIIKRFEGCVLHAYKDAVGIWTIGYGHTGPDVTPGLVIDQAAADALLAKDVERFEQGIGDLVSVPLTQNQFDALVSFTFNVGLGAFKKSTMRAFINDGLFEAAARQFSRWDRAGGKRLAGLTIRRAAEMSLFMQE